MQRRLGWLCFFGILIAVASPVESAVAPKPNIVLVTLDSVRADRVGILGARSRLTPNLDALARQAIIFERAYAQAPDTVASTATILTGTYPQTHRASGFGGPLAASLPYLPDLLRAAGYRTAAVAGSILVDPYEGPFQGYDRGFNDYVAGFHLPQEGQGRYQSVALRGDQVIARAIAWLTKAKGRSFFLWLNLPDAGTPGASYDRAVAASDLSLGRLVSFLRAQSLFDDMLIVVASAHGEGLGAHGEDRHGIFLYDETIHVPLVLKLPANRLAGKRVQNRARLLDIAPTVLEVAGVPSSPQMQGQSLVRMAQAGAQADQPAYARSELPRQGFGCSLLESWRAGKYLYVRAPAPELYDLAADPGATRNLASASKATLDTMASQLQALDSRLGNEPGKSSSAGLSSSELQKLASLGYVGLQPAGSGVTAAAQGDDPGRIISRINQVLGALADLEDGKPDKALPVLKQALALNPKIYLAQYGMGAALVQLRQYREAIGYLHQAIELQPDSAWAHRAMGESLIKIADFKTAAVHLEIASGRLPGSGTLHSELAEVYEHLGRKEDAAREHARATQIKPAQ